MFDPDIVWALIPLAPFLLGGFAIWTRHKQKALEMELEIAKLRAVEKPAMNDRLEQRVRTLERIITDGNSDLARQIEDLRDAPLN